MSETHVTFCRFCHAFCGIKVTVENGRATKVIGDRDNPLYHGYSCIKGRALPEQHYHPERLLHTMKKAPNGGHAPIEAAQAMNEIAEKLSVLIARHGPRSVALYSGTFGFVHKAGSTLATSFMDAIASPMRFSTATIDQPGKPIAAGLHGRWNAGRQSFADTDSCLLIGTNPLVSMYSGGALPPFNPAKLLHDAKKRGLKLIVIDPRRTECAARADLFLQPKPGEDPSLLAGIIRVLIVEELYDRDFVADNVEGLAALADAVAPFAVDYVAARAGIPADQVTAAARMFAAGKRGHASCGTGPSMAPHGTLTEYLTLILNTLCGRWARAGEPLANPYVLVPQPAGKAQAEPRPRDVYGFGEKLRVRGLATNAAGLQTAALAEEILLEGEGQVKALISLGGNPMAAWPDQLRTYKAMKALELNVTLDPRMSATAKLADYVIAPKLTLEVASSTVANEIVTTYAPLAGYHEPYGQSAPKIVDPPAGAEVIEEWEFFFGLEQRMALGLSVAGVALDMTQSPTTEDIYALMSRHSRIPLSEVQKYPHGHIFEDPTIIVQPKDADWPHKLDVGAKLMMEELTAVMREPRTNNAGYGDGPAFAYRLIARRLHEVYNSSGRDIPILVRRRRHNPAFMNPADMAQLDVKTGDVIEISSGYGTILGIAEEDESVRAGVVSMTHCFGDAPEHDGKLHESGSNVGRLTDNTGMVDRFSAMPLMSAIPVNLQKAEHFSKQNHGP